MPENVKDITIFRVQEGFQVSVRLIDEEGWRVYIEDSVEKALAAAFPLSVDDAVFSLADDGSDLV